MRGGLASASRIGSTTNRPFAAATGCTTRTSRSASSAVRRRRDSPRTRLRRTTPTASFRRTTWTRGSRQDRVQFPPFIDPTINLGGNVTAVTPDGLTLPRFQNWSVTYQRELTDNMMLDISYIGNRGSRLNHHFETLGVGANMNDPSVLALGTAVLQSNINSDLARNAGIPIPYPGFNGNVAQALREFPQYQQHPVARRADRPEPVPRDGTGAGASVLTWSAGARRLHVLAPHEQRDRDRAGK